ncbi:MAG: RsmD family RNA methyltransferase [Planctomycetota bacterium]|nr:RsmD family RNA methyltransferase [Planctomycetota bacterium]
MRIIAGEFRHRSLATPPDAEVTRPIPDRVKESLFSLLRGHFEGATVFDAFAGVGTIGLECLSRGAARVVMVEQDRRIAEFLRRNVESLGVQDRCDVVVGDALGTGSLARAPRPLHLAFFDPPFPLVREPVGFARVVAQVARAAALLTDDGFVVLRTPWPFVHEAGAPQPTAVASPAPRRKNEPRNAWKRDLRRAERGVVPRALPESIGDVEPAGDGDPSIGGEVSGDDAAGAAPTGGPVTPDLRIPGATGPETHVYRSMAVHLYMRARA